MSRTDIARGMGGRVADSGRLADWLWRALARVAVGLLVVVSVCTGCGTTSPEPGPSPIPPEELLANITGPYLGQVPPGAGFTQFAPGIVPGALVNSVTVSPDGREIYWAAGTGITSTTMTAEGRWTTPRIVSFGGTASIPGDDAPVVSPDNRTLFFNARVPGATLSGWRFSRADRTATGWSQARPLPDAINALGGSHWQLSIANSGAVYFGVWDAAGARIYRAQSVDAVPEPVASLNRLGEVGTPFIAPDETYIIFSRIVAVGGHNEFEGSYISLRGPDGQWLPAERLSSFPWESSFVTRDGQYVFCKAFWASARAVLGASGAAR